MRFTLSPSRCPKCGSVSIRKSRQERSFIEAFFTIFIIACRCHTSDFRFFRPSWYGAPVKANAKNDTPRF